MMVFQKAYNKAVRYCRGINPDALICLFDDDSAISVDYFNSLQSTKKNHPESKYIFLY